MLPVTVVADGLSPLSLLSLLFLFFCSKFRSGIAEQAQLFVSSATTTWGSCQASAELSRSQVEKFVKEFLLFFSLVFLLFFRSFPRRKKI